MIQIGVCMLNTLKDFYTVFIRTLMSFFYRVGLRSKIFVIVLWWYQVCWKKESKYCRNDPENFETLVCIQNIEDTRNKTKNKKKKSVPSLMKLIQCCICSDLKQSTCRQSSRNIQNNICFAERIGI